MPKKNTDREMKRFRVPAVHVLEFGCEVEVVADSKASARLMVRQGKGNVVGDGYDWNRMRQAGARVRAGEPIESEPAPVREGSANEGN